MRLATPAIAMVLYVAQHTAFCQQAQKFPDHGFKITPPANWTLIPPRPGEQWILAHFMGDREYTHRNPETATTTTHRPRMREFVCPERDSRVEVELVKETEARSTTTFRYPYRDYADYLKRHDHGGGYFVASSDELTVGGLSVTKQEVKIER